MKRYKIEKEYAVRGAIFAGLILLAGILFYVLLSDRTLISRKTDNVLFFVLLFLAVLCVIFPTRAERREKIYRMSSPVRLALGIVALTAAVVLFVLVCTAKSWAGLAYLVILVCLVGFSLPLLLFAIIVKIVFMIRKKMRKE